MILLHEEIYDSLATQAVTSLSAQGPLDALLLDLQCLLETFVESSSEHFGHEIQLEDLLRVDNNRLIQVARTVLDDARQNLGDRARTALSQLLRFESMGGSGCQSRMASFLMQQIRGEQGTRLYTDMCEILHRPLQRAIGQVVDCATTTARVVVDQAENQVLGKVKALLALALAPQDSSELWLRESIQIYIRLAESVRDVHGSTRITAALQEWLASKGHSIADDNNTATLQLPEPRTCGICFNRLAETRLQPCSHSVSCETCTLRVVELGQPCPICRTPIQHYALCGASEAEYLPSSTIE